MHATNFRDNIRQVEEHFHYNIGRQQKFIAQVVTVTILQLHWLLVLVTHMTGVSWSLEMVVEGKL